MANYLILIDLIDNNQSTFAQLIGNDIVFTNNNVIKLSHEIESYDSTTGHLVAWMKIPSLSSTVNTSIYMYYSNPSALDQH